MEDEWPSKTFLIRQIVNINSIYLLLNVNNLNFNANCPVSHQHNKTIPEVTKFETQLDIWSHLADASINHVKKCLFCEIGS